MDISLIAAIIAVIWASIGFHLVQERREMAARGARDSRGLAWAAEENIGQTITAIDATLRFMRAAYAREPARFDLADWASRIHRTDGTAWQFAVIGSDGRLAASSPGAVAKPADLSDQEYFRVQRERAEDRLFVGQPIAGRSSGRWLVPFTRKLLARHGTFAGVLVAFIDPSWLTHPYHALDIGRGVLTLVGTDGVVRARSGISGEGESAEIGRNLGASRMVASGAGHGTFTAASLVDGVERTFSFRRLEDYPLTVAVGLDTRSIFAPYARDVRQLAVFGGILTLLMLIAGGLLVHHKRRLIISRQALSDAVENISQGLLMIDGQRRMPVLNQRAIELLGLPPELLARNPTFEEIRDWQIRSGEFGTEADGRVKQPEFDKRRGIVMHEDCYERVRPDGTVLEIRTRPLANGGAVRTYSDITERKRAEDRIHHLAHHDGLTGLPNRVLMSDRLAQLLAQVRRGGAPVAVLALDLDRFKAVNDALGHTAGDRLLALAAERLSATTRAGDTVARVGGDEFVVLQSGGAQPTAAAELARRLVATLSEPFDLEGQPVVVGTSIGIALHPTDETDTGAGLLKNADTALYRAKAAGRGNFRFFEAEMDRRLTERRTLERDLRIAIGSEQMALHFQPLFDCRTGVVTGFEALLRWRHPTLGLVGPTEFIPIAEESGLIVPLGLWVLERACTEAASWGAALRVAVNLSPAQFHGGDLPGQVADVLRRTGLPPERLELEVTETLLIGNTDQALTTLRALKEMGVRIALDDFGTGYSSLSYLRCFPFDKVKVDKSFVQALDVDSSTLVIVQAILAMCRSLGLHVVAEGVETERQWGILREQRCGEIQGFLLGRPMPAEEVSRYSEAVQPARPQRAWSLAGR